MVNTRAQRGCRARHDTHMKVVVGAGASCSTRIAYAIRMKQPRYGHSGEDNVCGEWKQCARSHLYAGQCISTQGTGRTSSLRSCHRVALLSTHLFEATLPEPATRDVCVGLLFRREDGIMDMDTVVVGWCMGEGSRWWFALEWYLSSDVVVCTAFMSATGDLDGLDD